MDIKAVKFRKSGFYTQPFAFGGEEGTDKFDKNIRYRGSLQNYLIDTGDEVILVDSGLPAGTPEENPDENSLVYTGKDICSYMEAFAALGYKPEQVTKILLTHKHSDHSGELKSFPNAKIYVNEEELSAAELQGIENIEPVKFTDGAYHNFPDSQKIVDGVYFIKAKGHTNGNSIVIVENDGLFYMIHGDITYVDEALYENKLSVVFDDLAEARITLDRVREFIRNNPTVYMGTHNLRDMRTLKPRESWTSIILSRPSLRSSISKRRKQLESTSAQSAVIYTTRLSMTELHSRTFLLTGNVPDVSSPKTSLIRHKLCRENLQNYLPR